LTHVTLKGEKKLWILWSLRQPQTKTQNFAFGVRRDTEVVR